MSPAGMEARGSGATSTKPEGSRRGGAEINRTSALNYHSVANDRGILLSCPRRESNPHLRFRKPSFYPLNYGDGASPTGAIRNA